jgi:hypothetical protein
MHCSTPPRKKAGFQSPSGISHHYEMPEDTGTISVSSVEDSITNVAALGSGPAASHRGLAVLRLGPLDWPTLHAPLDMGRAAVK